MKYLLSALSFLIITASYGQSGTPVLFISNQDSKLFIDGVEISPLSNNSPYKIYLNSGDHVAQAKNENEIVTQKVSCTDAQQKVVSFNFADVYTKNREGKIASDPGEQLVINTTVEFCRDVVFNVSTENKYFSFDVNDKIKFHYKLNDPDGTLNLYVFSYPDNKILYSKESVIDLTDSFKVANKGVYYFSMTNNHIQKRNATLKITRIAAATSKPNFKTSVISKPDTTFRQISAETYTLTKDKIVIPINVPANSRFWVYWIGIGNEAIINYDNYCELYSEGKSGNDIYPAYGFGTGRLNSLTTVSSKDVMEYGFADKVNSQNFLAGKQYDLYTFKHGKGITTDFAKVDVIKSNMHLLVTIPQACIGQKMKIVVASFQVKNNYIIDPVDL